MVPSDSAAGDGEVGDGVEGVGVADARVGLPGRRITGRSTGADVPVTSRLRCQTSVGAVSNGCVAYLLLSLWPYALRDVRASMTLCFAASAPTRYRARTEGSALDAVGTGLRRVRDNGFLLLVGSVVVLLLRRSQDGTAYSV